jgi:hypothetical protein
LTAEDFGCKLLLTVNAEEKGMLTLTNKTTETANEWWTTGWDVEGTVQLAGDSLWDYEGADTVKVTDIAIWVGEDDDYAEVTVGHDSDWRIYTDSGFERAISEALGFEVQFTEQGMQQDGVASMETCEVFDKKRLTD